MNILKEAKTFVALLRDSFREFQLNDPLRMAAATAFFASFALPPILIILIEVFGFFGDSRTVSHDLFEQLGNAINKDTVSQIRVMLRNVRHLSLSRGMKTGGFIFLLFVATTLFSVIKNSLNQLWKIRPKKGGSVAFILFHKAKSFGIIIIAGLLFFIVLDLFLKGVIYRVASRLTVVAWLVLIFKYLADGRPGWKVAIAGGFFTGLLFTIGVVLLHVLLIYNEVKTIYGASTALVLLLLFVFYSSFIFYYGACFTKIFAIHIGEPILPTRHAVGYMLQSVEWEGESAKKHP